MTLPEIIRKSVVPKLKVYCKKKFPARLRDRVRGSYRIQGLNITLYEERIGFLPPYEWCKIPVAQFRYDPRDGKWTLYQSDQHSRWELYLDADSTADFDKLLKEVDKDPTGIFWG
ncbi:MAG: DUF3024 domain-containing protein [candidate division WOR-3 bacterium]